MILSSIFLDIRIYFGGGVGVLDTQNLSFWYLDLGL